MTCRHHLQDLVKTICMFIKKSCFILCSWSLCNQCWIVVFCNEWFWDGYKSWNTFEHLSLVSIHVLVGRTMYGHQWSQAITAFATKACELATKSHMLNFCEGLRGLCRNMLWLWSIETNNARNKKDFLSSKKKAKTKKTMPTYGKSLFLIKYRMRYTIYMPLNTKYLAINQTMVAYGNRQSATAFALANNSDLLRSQKHLMETRLYIFFRTIYY